MHSKCSNHPFQSSGRVLVATLCFPLPSTALCFSAVFLGDMGCMVIEQSSVNQGRTRMHMTRVTQWNGGAIARLWIHPVLLLKYSCNQKLKHLSNCKPHFLSPLSISPHLPSPDPQHSSWNNWPTLQGHLSIGRPLICLFSLCVPIPCSVHCLQTKCDSHSSAEGN